MSNIVSNSYNTPAFINDSERLGSLSPSFLSSLEQATVVTL